RRGTGAWPRLVEARGGAMLWPRLAAGVHEMLERQLTSGRCDSCGETVADTARFCSSCGAPLDGPSEVQPTAGDELRPVTALFADIVGSTHLGERLTPDEV